MTGITRRCVRCGRPTGATPKPGSPGPVCGRCWLAEVRARLAERRRNAPPLPVDGKTKAAGK